MINNELKKKYILYIIVWKSQFSIMEVTEILP